jgi:hypothetical protein
MVFLLYPTVLLLAISADLRDAPLPTRQPPPTTVQTATFDPNAPPSWWTAKMRQPCTKTGDRLVC